MESGARVSTAGWNTARRRICSTPTSTSTCARWFDGLNHIDRHILKESFRTARRLLSKIGRDYPS